MARTALVCGVALALAGCGWMGTSDTPPLPGQRISVLTLDSSLTPDARVADLEVRLPRPEPNENWPQPGGFPNHAMHHLAVGGELKRLWRASIGEGSDSDSVLLAQPVVAGGRVYTLDTKATVSAFAMDTGERLWRRELRQRDESDGPLGGGVAFADGRLFVTTGFAVAFALDAADGKELWRRAVSGPMRAGPTVYGGRVFAITIANQVHALGVGDGKEDWTQSGTSETAGLMGGASPAADDGIVVVPYSSGELFALRAGNGRVLWSDSLSSVRRTDPVSALAHIRGAPVIDDGRVYAISHSGRMAAFDLTSGRRVWERQIGGTQKPWLAGDFIYVLSTSGELVCLLRRDGRVRWVRALERFQDPKEKSEPITWVGPVLAGDRLLVAGSNRDVWSISPYTGRLMGRIRLPRGTLIPPVIADQTVLFLTDGAELIALR